MSAEILRVHPDEPQPNHIDYIVACLRNCHFCALPTDTFFGQAVDPVEFLCSRADLPDKDAPEAQAHVLVDFVRSPTPYELARDTDPLLKQAWQNASR